MIIRHATTTGPWALQYQPPFRAKGTVSARVARHVSRGNLFQVFTMLAGATNVLKP